MITTLWYSTKGKTTETSKRLLIAGVGKGEEEEAMEQTEHRGFLGS